MVDVGSIMNNITTVMLWLLVIGVIIFAGIFIIRLLKFKHQVIVKYLTEGATFVVQDKAREVNQNGEFYWRLQKLRENIPVPPSQALQMTKKGKFLVEVYRTPQGEYVFLDAKPKQNLEESISEPITQNDRMFYVEQWHKAEARKTKGWKDIIEKGLPYFVVVMILVLVFAFWGTITQPMKEVMSKSAGITTQQKEIVEMQKQILQNNQVLKGETETIPD